MTKLGLPSRNVIRCEERDDNLCVALDDFI